MYWTQPDCNAITDRLQSGAEKELAAYALAVQELFGEDVASQSIEDWIEDMHAMDWPGHGASPDWRRVTIAAAARLAGRLHLQNSILQRLTA
jgi:hypothetical protein